MLKNGINGKLYKNIMSMYECVKAREQCGSALTEYIYCASGVNQGDICSPVLFSLFIQELTTEVIDAGRHGASFSKELLEIFILLLADDIVLIAETVVGLQNQLQLQVCHAQKKKKKKKEEEEEEEKRQGRPDYCFIH